MYSRTPNSLHALRVYGREAIYVDLEADPKIDRENPPDLAKHVPEAVAPAAPDTATAAPAAPASAPSTVSGNKAAPTAAPPKPQGKKADASKPKDQGSIDVAAGARHRELADVSSRVEDVMQKVSAVHMYEFFSHGGLSRSPSLFA